MDKLTLYSKGVEIAEARPGEDIHAKFCLCDFGTNHNGTKLNRDTIDTWVGTIINKPLVGRIRGGDFTGHNMRVVNKIDNTGNQYQVAEFDTDAFGTFTGCAIETIDNQEVITATCDIWARFANVCELIKKRFEEGTLHTSWEIAVGAAHIDESGAKVIDDGRFTGLCVLGAKTPPAYDSSMMIEAAEQDCGDNEFVSAFESDISTSSTKDEETVMEDIEISTEDVELEPNAEVETSSETTDSKVEENAEVEKPVDDDTEDKENPEDESKDDVASCVKDEEKAEEEEKPEEEVETSALTVCDIECKIRDLLYKCDQGLRMVFPEEHVVWAKDYRKEQNELDFIQYTYTISGDTVALGKPEEITLTVSPREINTAIAEKIDAIVTANEKIQNLESEIAELRPYKEAADKVEHDKKVSDMRELAEKSGMFDKSELDSGDVAMIIAELNEEKLKLCIADRYMAKQKDAVSVETASRTERNLYNEEDTCTSLLSAYINKR